MAQEDYREFICSYIGKECGFQVRAKTEEEVMEHAKTHVSESHMTEETPSETERKIRKNIRPVKIEISEPRT